MKSRPRYLKRRKTVSAVKVLFCIFLILLLVVILMIAKVFQMENSRKETAIQEAVSTAAWTEALPLTTAASVLETAEPTEESASEPTLQTAQTEPTEEPIQQTTQTEPTEKEYLPYLKEYFDKNGDVVGWLKIEGTKLDYPLMYTPEDPEKYLHLNFNEKYSYGGLPFLDANCSLSPESGNLIIYGHNMLDGSMFRTLMKYDQKTYWEKHPIIKLDLIDEEREYEILAAFYDRVYYTYETCFKFYKFIDTDDQEKFDEAIAYYKENSLYDTGVTAQRGDRLITLVTCAYHVENGRFVVIARERVEQES